VIGVVQFLAGVVAIWSCSYFSRRTLLTYGHGAIAVIHYTLAACIVLGYNYMELLMILLFMIAYDNSSGPIAWLYVAETVEDIALGVCVQVLWTNILILALTTQSAMDNPSIGPQGVFIFFGTASLIATFFAYFFICETKGLSDVEKKRLYIPGAPKAYEKTH
jgi:hypothetical protein